MKHQLACLLAMALVATACTREGKPPGSETASGVTSPPASSQAPQASPPQARPMPLTPPDGLPAYTFAHVPGWLALTTAAADARQYGFSPAHPNATAVIMNADPWAENVEEGTRFRLVAREGNLPLTLSEVSRIPYGCDDIPVTMAAFRTPHDLAEQVAWILPAAMEGAASVPIVPGERSAGRRTDSLDDLTITLSAGGNSGRLEIKRGQALVHEQTFDVPATEDAAVPDLTNDLQLGALFPAAAFRLDAGTTVLVLRSLSLESVWFHALLIRDGRVTDAGKISIYLCAN